MSLQPIITFRHMSSSEALEATIRERAAKLERFCNTISKCEIVVEAPSHAHAHGAHFRVRIELHVPGDELIVDRDPKEAADHRDVQVALRDAFDAAKRQLQAYNDKHR
jgi:ribosomal subunit interface protein